jgi:hypothetical protein
MQNLDSLEAYLATYGPLLGKQAQQSLAPLHLPGRDGLPELRLLRQPFEAQAHVVAATAKTLRRQKSCLIVAECGVGKTLLAMAAAHAHAGGRPYRALVFCPGQLCRKWQRELEETIPGAVVRHINSFADLLDLDRRASRPGVEWWIVGRDRAKLGARWRGAAWRRLQMGEAHLRCPTCGRRLLEKGGVALTPAALARERLRCQYVLEEAGVLAEGCGAPLWQYTGALRRWEPARYIHKRLKGFFDYLVLDEIHEEKSADSAQGNAAGSLAAACKKVLALTGTLIGGYAEHLRPLLFRLAPRSLIEEGLGWKNAIPFSERYGRIETVIRDRGGAERGADNKQSRGSSRSKTKTIRPGVMPTLFGRHLIGNSVFLSLSEVADNLPLLTEEVHAIPMDGELAGHYAVIDKALTTAIKDMLVRSGGGDRRLLGTMLNVLLAYPDYPYDWGPVGYSERGEGGGDGAWITVCTPANLAPGLVREKEKKLIELVKAEVDWGRQVWVYVQYTDKRDVQSRLEGFLKAEGLRVGSLRASVAPAKREEWIATNAPVLDVVLSHPRLVETGLDLFDKRGRHNFSTLIFYETGYNLFTMRQASRRAWRIGQKLPCKVLYLYYASTLQERAMALMGRKMAAALAIEGKFSSEGLAAMAGEDGGSVEMALARSLADRLEEGDAQRSWGKVCSEPAVIPLRPRLSREDRIRKILATDFAALRQRRSSWGSRSS